jgi:hypothetical protein
VDLQTNSFTACYDDNGVEDTVVVFTHYLQSGIIGDWELTTASGVPLTRLARGIYRVSANGRTLRSCALNAE